jgi:hypothetical protein
MKIRQLVAVLVFCLVLGSILVVIRMVGSGPDHLFLSKAPPDPAEDSQPLPGPAIFHEPQTEAEKLLDYLISLDESGGNFYHFILGTPEYDPAQDPGYARFFSPALLKAFRKKEASLVKKNCDGKYIDGDICGLDYTPIICGQGWPDAYIYRTIKPTRDSAIVITSWQPHADSLHSYPAYRFIRVKDHWKLDGVACGKDEQFNMPPRF